ncbi:MAG: NupC/NupG family nucleoside CNT transporter [Cyclobacteriaceae bacterium]
MTIVRAILGIVFLVSIAWIFSVNRRAIRWQFVLIGIAIQAIFGILITKVELATTIFNGLSEAFVKMLSFTNEGTKFLFGSLVTGNLGFIFALNVLPTVIFFSTLTAGLYHLGILQRIVSGIAWFMTRALKLSGAESLSMAGNIFLGQTEAPLLVRPFIKDMTRSELMCLMTGGMATIAGGVLAGYVLFLGGDSVEEQNKYAAYLLSASFMNAPAAIVFSKIMIPETQFDKISREVKINSETEAVNLIDAFARGASEGLKLALNIGAMLLAFIALIALANFLLKHLIGEVTGLNPLISKATNGRFEGLSLQYVLGSIFRIFAFAMGVDWHETLEVGSLLGQKTVINEFVAYFELSKLKEAGILSPKAEVISAYALCGFSNFSSIAIQIGGIGGMAPNQQGNLSKLGMRALLAASLATMLTGTLAGLLVSP